MIPKFVMTPVFFHVSPPTLTLWFLACLTVLSYPELKSYALLWPRRVMTGVLLMESELGYN